MILVSGANGFIGRHVVRCAATESTGSHAAATPAAVKAFDVHFGEDFATSVADVETVQGNLADDALLARSMQGVDTVVHLASKYVDHDGSGFDKVNVEGTRSLCRAAAAAGVARVIYLSSVGVYGHGAHRDADETTTVAPDTPLSHSKATAEGIVLEHTRAGDFQGVVLRHRFVYGEGDGAVLPRLIKAARSYPFWLSGGRARMSLIWAPDLAQVIRQLADPGRIDIDDPHPVYHVTDGEPISYRRVITTICRAFDYRPPRFSVPYRLLYAPVRLRELLLGIDPEVAESSVTSIRLALVAQDNDFSNRKLQTLLPDLTYTSFEEGFRRSLDFYSQFG
ncbi:MAG: NAD-dependent epimerase/dehydratase family protein [Acidobacteriota bacterium]